MSRTVSSWRLWGFVFLAFYAVAARAVETLTAHDGKDEMSFKGNALLQAWTIDDNTVHPGTPSLNFRLRRAELKASGQVVPGARYFVMLDPAKAIRADAADNRVLQDLGLVYTIVPGVDVTAGQFKLLTNAEGLASSVELLLPERSRPSRLWAIAGSRA